MNSSVHRLGPVVGGLLVLGGCFAASFVSALHSPQPHGLPVAIAAPPAVVSQLSSALSAQGQPLALRTGLTPARAESAVRSHAVDGALVVSPPRATVFIASAGGRAPAEVISSVLTTAAKKGGGNVEVRDLVPLPRHDSEGLSAVFLTISILLPSLVYGIASSLRVPDAPARVALTGAAAFAVLLGALNVWITDGLIGALVGSPWALAGLAMLASFAISGTTIACRRVLGFPGIGLAALLLMVYGFPASGVAVGPSFTPAFYRHVAEAFPAGAAITGFRDAAYFSGGGHQAWVLAFWGVGAAVVAAVADWGRRQRRLEPASARHASPALAGS